MAIIDACLVALLAWRVRSWRFAQLGWPIALTAAAFWGLMGVAMLWGFWDLYYQHFFPAAARWLVPPVVVLYDGALGYGLWWLAARLPGRPVLTVCLLGGASALPEHLWGIYSLRILETVPFLRNAGALPVLVFSFFEYALYWAIILGVAALLSAASRRPAAAV